jgi:hypothetical protein
MNCPEGYICHSSQVPTWAMVAMIAVIAAFFVGMLLIMWLDYRETRDKERRWRP